MKRIFQLLTICFLILLFKSNVLAQYAVQQSVFGNGAAIVLDGSHALAGTAGQILSAESSNSSFAVTAGFWYQAVDIYTAVEQSHSPQIPKEFCLYQNYPNPFNPSTTIRFDIAKAGKVYLKIFDLLGREVITLVNEKMQAGEYRLVFDAGGLPSGMYFYQIQADEFTQLRKLTLLK